jgi:hypothetical protein
VSQKSGFIIYPSSESATPRRSYSPSASFRSPRPSLSAYTEDASSYLLRTDPSLSTSYSKQADLSRRALASQSRIAVDPPANPSNRLDISPNDSHGHSISLNASASPYSALASRSKSVISPFETAMTETLERQPRLASGYEWDERHHSVSRGQDGTACLSVEPDGDGYLGESRLCEAVRCKEFKV